MRRQGIQIHSVCVRPGVEGGYCAGPFISELFFALIKTPSTMVWLVLLSPPTKQNPVALKDYLLSLGLWS